MFPLSKGLFQGANVKAWGHVKAAFSWKVRLSPSIIPTVLPPLWFSLAAFQNKKHSSSLASLQREDYKKRILEIAPPQRATWPLILEYRDALHSRRWYDTWKNLSLLLPSLASVFAWILLSYICIFKGSQRFFSFTLCFSLSANIWFGDIQSWAFASHVALWATMCFSRTFLSALGHDGTLHARHSAVTWAFLFTVMAPVVPKS